INMDKGTIECWIKPNFGSDDPFTHPVWNFWDTHGLFLVFLELGLLRLYIVHEGGTFTIQSVEAFNANDLLHLAVTWDREGNDINGNKTVVLYRDNVEIASSVTIWNASPGIATNLQILHRVGTFDV
ncbi:unnamed protein product, partial [marine sediment metagenome]